MAAQPVTLNLFETHEQRCMERMDEVLSSTELTDRQKGILRHIASHRGLHNALPLDRLAEWLQCSARDVKGDVRELRLMGAPIGSSRSGVGGYYTITTLEEERLTLQGYLNQALSELRIVRAIGGSARLQEAMGQMRMELEG